MSIGKPCHYCDGTLSREVDDDEENDDWEATGQEEMNDLHIKTTQERKKILNARDQLLRCKLIETRHRLSLWNGFVLSFALR